MRNKVLHALLRLDVQCRVVLDVGANIGQSALEFRTAFPDAAIHAFEPVPAAYAALTAAVASDPLTITHHLALSSTPGELQMTRKGASTGNRVVAKSYVGDYVRVPAETGDRFCSSWGIVRVDVLKVDAEGHDLDVLVGFGGMLRGGCIRFVQAEVALSSSNHLHVPLERVMAVMTAFGYGFYGLFGLHPLRGSSNLSAHYGDAVFVKDGWPGS